MDTVNKYWCLCQYSDNGEGPPASTMTSAHGKGSVQAKSRTMMKEALLCWEP